MTNENTYQDEINFVAEHIIKVRYSDKFTISEENAAFSAAHLLGFEMQRENTNDLVHSAFIEADFMENGEIK